MIGLDALQCRFSVIVAFDRNYGIGRENELLCHLPGDLRWFRKHTLGHTLIMGRKTFESLPNGPLPGRRTIVITHAPNWDAAGVEIAHSISEALSLCPVGEEVFVAGGGQIYAAFLPLCSMLYLTRIEHAFEADVWFPPVDFSAWELLYQEEIRSDAKNPYDFSFNIYRRSFRAD